MEAHKIYNVFGPTNRPSSYQNTNKYPIIPDLFTSQIFRVLQNLSLSLSLCNSLSQSLQHEQIGPASGSQEVNFSISLSLSLICNLFQGFSFNFIVFTIQILIFFFRCFFRYMDKKLQSTFLFALHEFSALYFFFLFLFFFKFYFFNLAVLFSLILLQNLGKEKINVYVLHYIQELNYRKKKIIAA